ncbi:MAG: hypothetical protein SVY53_05355 [Chloroflexota bacterium]|nr:hypothetical protein [Chloroflexota bacterium]
MNMVDVVRNLWLKSRVKYEDEETYGDLINTVCSECSTECEMQEECLHFQQVYAGAKLTKFCKLEIAHADMMEEKS